MPADSIARQFRCQAQFGQNGLLSATFDFKILADFPLIHVDHIHLTQFACGLQQITIKVNHQFRRAG